MASDPNHGAGWNVHDTPYGPIHSYDGSGNYGSGQNNGNNGGDYNGVSKKSFIYIPNANGIDGRYMSMCVTNLKDNEGFKNTMYKDNEGNITVGIGHYLANADAAADLNFTRTKTQRFHDDDRVTEVKVSKDDVKKAFNEFKKNSKNVPSYHLSNDDVISTCIKDVKNTEKGLKGLYPGYDKFSNSRKTALVDMGFNLGINKLKNDFPNFNDAVNKGDWERAARESHRNINQRGDSRNKKTADQLRQNN